MRNTGKRPLKRLKDGRIDGRSLRRRPPTENLSTRVPRGLSEALKTTAAERNLTIGQAIDIAVRGWISSAGAPDLGAGLHYRVNPSRYHANFPAEPRANLPSGIGGSYYLFRRSTAHPDTFIKAALQITPEGLAETAFLELHAPQPILHRAQGFVISSQGTQLILLGGRDGSTLAELLILPAVSPPLAQASGMFLSIDTKGAARSVPAIVRNVNTATAASEEFLNTTGTAPLSQWSGQDKNDFSGLAFQQRPENESEATVSHAP